VYQRASHWQDTVVPASLFPSNINVRPTVLYAPLFVKYEPRSLRPLGRLIGTGTNDFMVSKDILSLETFSTFETKLEPGNRNIVLPGSRHLKDVASWKQDVNQVTDAQQPAFTGCKTARGK
jgi:hypothetical protein